MAAVLELPYEVQQFEVRRRAEFKASNGYAPVKYLTPQFLSYFPLVMESSEDQDRLSWNEVSGLFRRRDAIPATFIDQKILVEQISLDIFGEPGSTEFAERRSLALFKLITDEGERYALTVVYLPSSQKRMDMNTALQAVYSTDGNAVALVGMPKAYSECAYMPEPTNGEHYTLLPVSGYAGSTFGPVGDFAAAVLTKGSTHVRVNNQAVVKLPGSFTSDTASRGLIDEVVYQRGSIWTNKDLVEVGEDDEPVVINGRTIAVEREILVSKTDVYTDTTTCDPLTLVACEPGFEPDDGEFTESVSEMQARVEEDIERDRKAQHEERIRQLQAQQSKVTGMDTTPAPVDPAAIPGTDLHIVTPEGVTMEDFSKTGQVTMDPTGPTDEQASTGNTGGPATQPQGTTGDGRAGTAISDAELSARLTMLKCLDGLSRDLNILEGGYYKCVDETRKVVKEVSADLDDLENAYVASIMKALAKWQESGAGGLTGHAHSQCKGVGQAAR